VTRACGAGKPNTGTVKQLWRATAQTMPRPSGDPETGDNSCSPRFGRRQNEATDFTHRGWNEGRRGNLESVEQEKRRQELVNAW